MNLYAFQLGREKDLCRAELTTVLREEKLVEQTNDISIFEIANTDTQDLQDRLGGTIKIIKIASTLPKDATQADIENSIESLLEQFFKDHKGKVPFALSTFNFRRNELNTKQILNFSKKILKSLGFSSRFVNKSSENPAPSTIYKSKTIDKGIDINIIKGKKTLYIGTAVTIQNIDAYSLRDYDKPRRDAKVGMLPPKLAQIMINLAGESYTILDPFCGTGTIPMEGLLMGKRVIGSDIELKLSEYSQFNLDWLYKTFQTEKTYRVFTKDAQSLTKEDLPETIDAIVTEGYLGTPQTAPPSQETQNRIFKELGALHLNWLTRIGKICPKSKIVMCLTAYQINGQTIHFPNFDELAGKAGYRIAKSFTYGRKDQLVVRDILVLEK